MKILFQRPKLYSLLEATNDNDSEKSAAHLEDQNLTEKDRNLTEKGEDSNKNGRQLTLGIAAGMLICCLAWTFTIWFYCGIRAEAEIAKTESDSEIAKALLQPLQCSSVVDEFRSFYQSK